MNSTPQGKALPTQSESAQQQYLPNSPFSPDGVKSPLVAAEHPLEAHTEQCHHQTWREDTPKIDEFHVEDMASPEVPAMMVKQDLQQHQP